MVAIPDQNVILMENYVNPPRKFPASSAAADLDVSLRRLESSEEAQNAHALAGTRLVGVDVKWDGASTSQWHLRRGRGALVGNRERRNGDRPSRRWRRASTRRNGTRTSSRARSISIPSSPLMLLAKRASRAWLTRTQPRHLVEDVLASVVSETRVVLSWPTAKKKTSSAILPSITGRGFQRIRSCAAGHAPLEQPSVGAIKEAIGKLS